MINDVTIDELITHLGDLARSARANLYGSFVGAAGIAYAALKEECPTEWRIGIGLASAVIVLGGSVRIVEKLNELSDIANHYRDQQHLKGNYHVSTWVKKN
jgi:hypothetical protein